MNQARLGLISIFVETLPPAADPIARRQSCSRSLSLYYKFAKLHGPSRYLLAIKLRRLKQGISTVDTPGDHEGLVGVVSIAVPTDAARVCSK